MGGGGGGGAHRWVQGEPWSAGQGWMQRVHVPGRLSQVSPPPSYPHSPSRLHTHTLDTHTAATPPYPRNTDHYVEQRLLLLEFISQTFCLCAQISIPCVKTLKLKRISFTFSGGLSNSRAEHEVSRPGAVVAAGCSMCCMLQCCSARAVCSIGIRVECSN